MQAVEDGLLKWRHWDPLTWCGVKWNGVYITASVLDFSPACFFVEQPKGPHFNDNQCLHTSLLGAKPSPMYFHFIVKTAPGGSIVTYTGAEGAEAQLQEEKWLSRSHPLPRDRVGIQPPSSDWRRFALCPHYQLPHLSTICWAHPEGTYKAKFQLEWFLCATYGPWLSMPWVSWVGEFSEIVWVSCFFRAISQILLLLLFFVFQYWRIPIWRPKYHHEHPDGRQPIS